MCTMRKRRLSGAGMAQHPPHRHRRARRAELADDVEVGPYAHHRRRTCASARARRIGPHCVIEGHTTHRPRQPHLPVLLARRARRRTRSTRGEPTRLEIGDRNTIREFCTFNLGTVQDAGVTRIGDDNWIMAYVHIAHDCQVGNHTIFANNAAAGRPCARGRLGHPRRPHRRAPVRARRRARDDRLPDPRVAGRAAVHDGRGQPAGRAQASTPRACAAAASRPSASPRSSRCTGCSTAQGLTLEQARADDRARCAEAPPRRRPTSR